MIKAIYASQHLDVMNMPQVLDPLAATVALTRRGARYRCCYHCLYGTAGKLHQCDDVRTAFVAAAKEARFFVRERRFQ